MSGLAGVVVRDGSATEPGVRRMLETLASRGDAATIVTVKGECSLGGRQFEWEGAVGRSRTPCVADLADMLVVADATLYYQRDLRRAVDPEGRLGEAPLDTDLIAAVVRRWGDRFARHLEGDFAVAVYLKPQRRLLLSRDAGGRRSLCYGRTPDGGVVFGTDSSTVLASPGFPATLNLDALAVSVAALPLHDFSTAWTGVREVEPATTLVLDIAGRLYEADRIEPPAFANTASESRDADEAAGELLALLERAVTERLPSGTTAAIWMSGGWDSSAVFGAGQSALRRVRSARTRLLPISLSYPAGDAGYEDHFIRGIVSMWESDIVWIPIDEIPLFDDARTSARNRSEPLSQVFEQPLRRLARAARSRDLRIVLDGVGGDQIFSGSDWAVLADLLQTGQWSELAARWRRRADRSLAAFMRRCVAPLISNPVIDRWRDVTGIRARGLLEHRIPDWVIARPSLLTAVRPHVSPGPGEGLSAYEARYMLTLPFIARGLATNHQLGLEEGVEIRSPLHDPRIVAFAASRPSAERNSPGETKVLLRKALTGLLPTEVLAPRRSKTGTTFEYARRQLSAQLDSVVRAALFGHGDPLLAQLGLVDTGRLRDAVERYSTQPTDELTGQIIAAVQTELWLASRNAVS